MPASPSSPTPDRDDRGRFAPGRPGGPGRPKANDERARLTALFQAFDCEAIAETAQVLLGIARDPEARNADRIQAVALLWRHSMPEPSRRAEIAIASADAGELRLAGSWPSEVDCQMLEQADRALAAAGLLGDVGAMTVEDVELHLGLSGALLRQIEEQREHDRQMAARYGLPEPDNMPQLSAPFARLIDRRLQAESRLTPQHLIANRHDNKQEARN